ncbi:MAG: hypothetical protein PQJ35_04700 [Sphaerochaetaceae bacterium]|nr:hypothetical protein [Sphaerochaetaceae bacterium]
MKKYTVIKLITLLLAAFALAGCNTEESRITMRVRLNEKISQQMNTRSLYSPAGEGLDIFGYIIEGEGPNDQTFSITTGSSQVDINGLMIGTWELKVTGINQQGTPIAKGETTFLLSTRENVVDISVDTLIGRGTLQAGFSWGDEVFGGITIQSTLTVQGGESVDISDDIIIYEGSSSAVYETQLDAGIYEIHYSLYSEGVKIAGGIDVIRILDDKTTVAEIELNVETAAPEATGLTIHSSIGKMIEGEITGIDDVILPNTIVEATFTDQYQGEKNYQVAWYLDGEYLATGESVQFSTYTGHHRLDAVAEGPLIGNMGSSTKKFIASVTPNGGLPVVVSHLTTSDVDAADNPYYLQNVSDSEFLRDGRILLASSQGLQICEIVNDTLMVLQNYPKNESGVSVASDSHPTQGITDITADSAEDIIFTTAKNLGIVVAYSYDSDSATLNKIASFDPSTASWSSSITNAVIDDANNTLFFVDRQDKNTYILPYSEQTISVYNQIPLGQFFYTIEECSDLRISNDNSTLIVTSSPNDTFHTYSIGYDYYGNPVLNFESNNMISSSHGNLEMVTMVDGKAHVLTDNGLFVYASNPGSGFYEYVEQVTTFDEHLHNIAYNNLYNKGWSINSTSQYVLASFSLLGGVPSYSSEEIQIPSLQQIQIDYSPKGNMLSLSGSSQLMLLRLNDY